MRAAWTGFLLSLSLCLDLGVVNLAVLRTAIQRGGPAAFLVGLGSCLGDLVYFSLAVVGATAFLNWAPIRWVLWIFGTSVLLFLAARMTRAVMQPKDIELEEPASALAGNSSGFLATGVGLALASPSSILWFAAIGGSVIASFGGDRRTLWTLGAGFFAGGVAWSALFAYGAAGLRRMMGRQVSRALSFLSALLFLYFALQVFLQGLQQMLR